ncbi:MAG: glycosyltransferase family 4 protein [Candidatus Magasanikbacteria bacterium]|nr:glycosyltransferase family 4 protein [Candidatus Magasanikbacteria bacterium]
MHIAVDIRCLTEKNRTGVGEYIYQLLDALFKIDTENQYFLLYNSFSDVSEIVPKWNQQNVQYVVSRWPNKLFNLAVLLGVIKLDTWVLRFVKKNNERIRQYYNPPLRGAGGYSTCADKTKAETLPNPPQGGRRDDNETIESRCESRLSLWASQSHTIDIFFSPNINFTHISPRTKFVLTIHDLSFELFKDCYSWRRRLWHWVVNPKKQCRRADLILTPSFSTKMDVEKEYGMSGEKVVCIYPGLGLGSRKPEVEEIKKVREKYTLPLKYILYLGTLEPRKNILAIIDAFSNSKLKTQNYKFIIAGSPGWKYKKILKKIDETPGVSYIGYIASEDKTALYMMSSLFVFPSLYEGFGFPVLEALSCGIPVITSNRSSLPELVESHACMINPDNVSEISKNMERILLHTSYHDMLVQHTDELERFSWEKSASELLEIFKRNVRI